MPDWYLINNIETVDSPALVVYKSRVQQNIDTVVSMVDDIKRLRPHVKTNKCKEAALLMMKAGISKFKCATIAEAEMLGLVAAEDVLLAYQPVGPKLKRFVELIKKYPSTRYSCLTDNQLAAGEMAAAATENKLEIDVFIDLNVGMNRTGITPGKAAIDLCQHCINWRGLTLRGLHAYDGHIRDADIDQRTQKCNQAYLMVEEMANEIYKRSGQQLVIVAGGSPTFPIHAKRETIECSPGTFIYWDHGYATLCAEQPFVPAALVISRIISLPTDNTICLDLGHKSIAAENDLQKRVTFLNAPGLVFIGQSEEHLIASVPVGHQYKPGDVLYGLPYHICPTVALYERAVIVENGSAADEWKTIARDRKISV